MGMARAIGAAAMVMVAAPALANAVDDANSGLTALENGNYPEAVRLFTRALASGELAPDDRALAYVKRGTAYLDLHNSKAATTDFQAALKLKPTDTDAKDGLARARSGRTGAAAGSGVQHETGVNALELARRGDAALNAADYEGAISLLSQAIAGRLSAEDLQLAYVKRGIAHVKHGDFHLGLQDIEVVLQRSPDNGDAQAALIEALGQMPPPNPTPAFNPATCKTNTTAVGNFAAGGKTYSTFVDYSSIDPETIFASLYRMLAKSSPDSITSQPWVFQAVNPRSGIITGSLSSEVGHYEVELEAHLQNSGNAARVTIKETLRTDGTGIVLVDVKGWMCKALATLGR